MLIGFVVSLSYHGLLVIILLVYCIRVRRAGCLLSEKGTLAIGLKISVPKNGEVHEYDDVWGPFGGQGSCKPNCESGSLQQADLGARNCAILGEWNKL